MPHDEARLLQILSICAVGGPVRARWLRHTVQYRRPTALPGVSTPPLRATPDVATSCARRTATFPYPRPRAVDRDG